MPLLQAALNGSRVAARGAVRAGAQVVHLHPYSPSGVETLAPEACAAALRAVRAACPGIPVSLTTSADVEPDPARRLVLVASWTKLPDLVTANQGEAGILELCELLLGRGVGLGGRAPQRRRRRGVRALRSRRALHARARRTFGP